jgi:3-oxo-4-pregnene-20-carboxyl-CoA dehydrogenase alpha subunit
VNTELSEEALAFGAAAAQAFERAGADELAALAVASPAAAAAQVRALLEPLGALELDLAEADALEAAAALMEAAGRHGIAHPLGARLARPSAEVEGMVVDAGLRTLALGGLEGRWRACGLDGTAQDLEPASGEAASAKDPRLVVVAERHGAPACSIRQVATALVLDCFGLLGTTARALELACGYARERQQFGQALARFQAVQFSLTDAEVERAGLAELARYALASLEHDDPDALADALALRLAAVEATTRVLRIAHQVHGAIGFCDETFLSWLTRSAECTVALPLGASGTTEALAELLGRRPLAGLFAPEEARR